MLTLARYTLKGPYQAAAIVALLAVVAVFLPLMVPRTPGMFMLSVLCSAALQFLSCTLVGLIILTQGSASGLKPIAASIVGISLVGWALIGMPELGISTGLVQWLPIILLAQTLRATRSLALTLMAGALLGAIAIGLQFLLVGDLQAQLAEMMKQRIGSAGELNQEVVDGIDHLARGLVVTMTSMTFVVFVLILLVARWLQARLADSKAFGGEFRSLAFGKYPAIATAAIVGASLLLQLDWLDSLGHLAMSMFLLQGIAILHHRMLPVKQGSAVLVAYYVSLFALWAIVMPLTAITGMADNWFAFRKNTEGSTDLN
jgi:hypothetical protein